MKKLLNEFRLEITILLVAVIAVILGVGDFGIGAWLGQAARKSIEVSQHTLQLGWSRFDSLISGLSLFDFFGLILVIAAFVFVGWRIRKRFLQSDYWLSAACPRCEGKLDRIHRSALDHWLTHRLLAHGRRYKCSNCGWSGLLHRREQLHRG
jgi:predicted RNA-binding Zn-ribbon protein involved in translation (DUF1610 family)